MNVLHFRKCTCSVANIYETERLRYWKKKDIRFVILGKRIYIHHSCDSPPLWVRRQLARLSRRGPGFCSRSGQVSWVRFFRGFSSPVRQMSGSFRPPRPPNIILPSLSSTLIIHYGRQWPEMLTRPKTLYIYIPLMWSGSNVVVSQPASRVRSPLVSIFSAVFLNYETNIRIFIPHPPPGITWP